jgi:hypothetical protein
MYMAQYKTGKQIRNMRDQYRVNQVLEEFARKVLSERRYGGRGSLLLFSISDGVWKIRHIYSRNSSEILDLCSNFPREQRSQLVPSLRFLCDVSKTRAGNSLGILLFAVLCKFRVFEKLKSILQNLECTAVWMLLCKPSQSICTQRVFFILSQLRNLQEPEMGITNVEKDRIRQVLSDVDFKTMPNKGCNEGGTQGCAFAS